ncbi:ATP-binding protein [Vampirovibrio sp.]|uniref:sensor histidine kinase n=1 Tax=Vampirovibrio sp. TaxID=2717857 RepID=UPI003593374A
MSSAQPVSKNFSQLKHLFREQHVLMMLLKEFRDGILICDRQGQILQVNRSLKQFLQLPKEDVVGRHVEAVIQNPAFLKVLATVLATGNTCVEEITLAQGDPHELFFEAHIVPINIPGLLGNEPAPLTETDTQAVDGCVIIFHDITDIRHTERMRRDFVANVSHELRTPLSAIEGYSETLIEGALDDPTVCRDFINVIHRHSLRLTQLVEDLLDLSKLESPDYKPELLPASLQVLIQQVLAMVQDKAEEKNIQLTVDIQEPLPKAQAELSSLQQVLTNLLDNAIKYTPTDGRVVLKAYVNDRQKIQVDVIDNGIGIEPKYHSRIFERFYRVDKARSREMGGTGLGLSIVKHIVQLHNGEIWVESNDSNGSTFSFTVDPVL